MSEKKGSEDNSNNGEKPRSGLVLWPENLLDELYGDPMNGNGGEDEKKEGEGDDGLLDIGLDELVIDEER